MTTAVKRHHEMYDKPEEIPLFSEAVVGYRDWRLDDWVLSPANYGPPWRPGVNTAKCHPDRSLDRLNHTEVPHPDCHCGFNMFFEPGDVHYHLNPGRQGKFVRGAVVGWGNMRVHPDGFRAEFAQIVALLGGEDYFELTAVATLYKVPLVDNLEQLQIEASKHGSPLPKSLRPPEKKQELDPFSRSFSGVLTTQSYSQILKQQWLSPSPFSRPYSGGYTTSVYPGSLSPTYYPPKKTKKQQRREAAKREQERREQLAAQKKAILAQAAKYNQHKFGVALTPAQRMDEMMKHKKIAELNELMKKPRAKYKEVPNPKKKRPWPHK